MNPQKFSAIAHRDHDYMNPLSAAKIERMLDLLPLTEHSRVLDLGCGRAELALRIIERFGSQVVAIDNSSLMLDAARERAEWTGAVGRLHLDNVDIRDFVADPETFHLEVQGIHYDYLLTKGETWEYSMFGPNDAGIAPLIDQDGDWRLYRIKHP